MKAAIIGASEDSLHAIDKAHMYGLSVTALDGNPNAAGLKAADKPIVTDISDESAVIEVLQKERPDFVLPVPIGRYLTTTGAVNDALSLPGISRDMAVLCTDKFLFHLTLQKQGLRACRCYAVGQEEITGEDGALYRKEQSIPDTLPLTFPAILKPRYGSGSRGIHMLADRESLTEALSVTVGEPYILEECVDGEEYGVDGAVTQDGFQMILLRKKENTPLPNRQAVAYFSVLPSECIWQEVNDYMAQVAACMGLCGCLLHADIIKGQEGLFAIELSARPSGHYLHDLFTPLCTGVDMVEEYIKYRMNQSYCFVPHMTKSMMIHYFDLQGTIARVPERAEIERAIASSLTAWQCNIGKGEKMQPAADGHSIMGRGYYIIENSDRDCLAKQAEIVKKLFCTI